jgi:hypothetical protein
MIEATISKGALIARLRIALSYAKNDMREQVKDVLRDTLFDLNVFKLEPSLDLARRLYCAHRFLAHQSGQRKDPNADDYIDHTWTGYCKEIGLPLRTARDLIQHYVPADESNDGKEYFLNAKEAKALAGARRAG